MTDEMSGWIRLGHLLGFASGPGLGACALLAAVALITLVLFRPQIGRLLDRVVILRVFGVYLLAAPDRERRESPTRREEDPSSPPRAPGA